MKEASLKDYIVVSFQLYNILEKTQLYNKKISDYQDEVGDGKEMIKQSTGDF